MIPFVIFSFAEGDYLRAEGVILEFISRGEANQYLLDRYATTGSKKTESIYDAPFRIHRAVIRRIPDEEVG